MKDLAELARLMTSARKMMENRDGGEPSPLHSLATNVNHTLSGFATVLTSIDEQLKRLNDNLERMSKQE